MTVIPLQLHIHIFQLADLLLSFLLKPSHLRITINININKPSKLKVNIDNNILKPSQLRVDINININKPSKCYILYENITTEHIHWPPFQIPDFHEAKERDLPIQGPTSHLNYPNMIARFAVRGCQAKTNLEIKWWIFTFL